MGLAGRREPIEIAGARGFAYDDVPGVVRDHVGEWLRAGTVLGAEVIRDRRLFRLEDLAVKLFGPARRNPFRDRLGVSAAVRFADLARRITAVATPQPVVALDLSANGARVRSVVCYGWIPGTTLDRIWGEDEAATRAFPAFMARMHRARVFHGDFHVHQVLWDGAQWFLIDLEGIRHPLRTLPVKRLATEHWGRVLFGLEVHRSVPADDLHDAFREYVAGDGVLGEAAWPRVCARAQELLATLDSSRSEVRDS